MLTCFLGAPISGKTTTAALLFAGLKDNGYVAEFLPEQARVYIAEQRRAGRDLAQEPLNDTDQLEIMGRQGTMELLFTEAAPKSIVVADAAAFLALLYMTPTCRSLPRIVAAAKRSAARFDLLFRCHPVKPGDLYDPNRVHSFEQSQALDAQLEEVMHLVEVPPEKVVELGGPSNVRASRAHYETLERFLCHR